MSSDNLPEAHVAESVRPRGITWHHPKRVKRIRAAAATAGRDRGAAGRGRARRGRPEDGLRRRDEIEALPHRFGTLGVMAATWS
jgi:hypothetical protein